MLSEQMPNFREIIKNEYAKKNSPEKPYSLRAYAQDLGISPSRLSEVMNSNAGLSRSLAQTIAQRLQLSEIDTQNFLDLVSSSHARSQTERTLAQKRLREKTSTQVHFRLVESSNFNLLDKWYYPALLELIEINGGQLLAKKFSSQLKISLADIDEAVSNLIRYKLIKKIRGKLLKVDRHLFIQSRAPSEKIRSFHKQIIKQASENAVDQPIEQRKVLSGIMSVRKDAIAEARDTLEKFYKEFIEKFSGDVDSDQVYCLSMQYFQVAKKVDQNE